MFGTAKDSCIVDVHNILIRMCGHVQQVFRRGVAHV